MQEIRQRGSYSHDIRLKNLDALGPRVKSAKPVSASPAQNPEPSKKNRRRLVIGGILGIIIITALAGGWIYMNRTSSPVPKNISKSVNFPVYYPDQKKLPKGYTLNLNSFKSAQSGVLYTVSYDGNKRLVFSVQKQPSDNIIQSFYLNYIPLRNQMQTNLGEAQIGAYGSGKDLKTVVSLPTNKQTWLIITAPYDINQNQLKQVLNSLRQ